MITATPRNRTRNGRPPCAEQVRPALVLRFYGAGKPPHKNGAQGAPGFEPGTSRSAVECSTTELYPHMHASVSTPDLQRPQHARVGGDWVGDRGRWPRRPTRSDRLARRDGYKRRGGGRWGRYDFPARLPGRRKQRRRTHYIGGT